MTNLVNSGQPNKQIEAAAWNSQAKLTPAPDAERNRGPGQETPSRFASHLGNNNQEQKPKTKSASLRRGPEPQIIAQNRDKPARSNKLEVSSPQGEKTAAHEIKVSADNTNKEDNTNKADKPKSKQSRSPDRFQPLTAEPASSIAEKNSILPIEGNTAEMLGLPPGTTLIATDPEQALAPLPDLKIQELSLANLNGILGTLTLPDKESLLKEQPVLALLSGHLEAIEPAKIPLIIAESPLIQELMSAPQSTDFLNKPIPMTQALALLGLDANQKLNIQGVTSSLDKAETNPLTTLNSLLKKLGFDPTRITAEADLLRDSLSFGDLDTYRERAERLQVDQGFLLLGQPFHPTNATLVPAQNELQTSQAASRLGTQAMPQSLNSLKQPADLGKRILAMTMAETVLQNSPINPNTDSFLLPPTFTAAPENLDPWLSLDLPTNGLQELAQPFSKVDQVQLASSTPLVSQSKSDPFTALSLRWDQSSVQTIFMNDTPKLDEQILTHALPLGSTPLRSLDDLLSRDLIKIPEAGSRLDANVTLQESLGLDLSSSMLGDEITIRSENNPDFSQQSDDQPGFQESDLNSFFNLQPTLQAKPAFTLQTGALAPAPSQMAQHVLQSALENSSMLIKDGGGSIRVDLGNQETGPLDLALNIQGKSVELRIITHSSQARDALMQDLPRLRESLLSQHLNLDKIEIGLTNSSAWSQSSGNDRQMRQQNFESFEEKSMREPQGIRALGRSYRPTIVQAQRDNDPLHNGIIQVRV